MRLVQLAAISLLAAAYAAAPESAAASAAFDSGLLQQDTTAADTTKQEKQEKKKDEPLPLEAARTLSFSTDEGTWMSLDVSPEGTTLVFDLLGDLYTMPLAGGEVTRLTEDMAFDAQPRFSPDGQSIVFTSDRSGAENVWTMSLDLADTTQITKGKGKLYQSPEWTPDGNYVVATKIDGFLGGGKLWMFHVEGGSGVQLIKQPEQLRTVGAAFGADERYIWFAQRNGSWQYNAQFPQYQLAVYDRETGRRFSQSAQLGSAFRPTLSPDGAWLAYGTRLDEHTGIRIRNLNTHEERWLAYPVQRDDQESRATRDVLPGMSFTPDSRELVASYGGKIWRIPVDGSAPIEVPFNIDVELKVGPDVHFTYDIERSPTFSVKQIRGAVPSPDGSQLAFTAMDRLWVMDYPDSQPRRLTPADMEIGEHQPVWSPDGRWIAYATWSLDGGQLFKVRSNGGRPQQLTRSAGLYQQPAWSPDGARIVAMRSSAEDFLEEATGPFAGGPGSELVWVPADGGAVTVIGPTQGRGAPHFTHDAGRIFLYAGGNDGEGLISMRWDGTDIKSHLKVTGGKPPGSDNPITAGVILMAPEGDKALAQVRNDLYVVTVPYVGGQTPTVSVTNPGSASFPVEKLTVVGGGFPAWSGDARNVHWSIGNAHFVYDLDDAQAFEDSVEAAEKAEAEAEAAADDAAAEADADDADVDAAANEAEAEEEEEEDADERKRYEAVETRVLIEQPRDVPQGTAVLRGARVITMNGDQVIENADVVIRNNQIEAVGAEGQVTVPDGADIIDVSGKTIVPGFVDVHAHIWPSWGIHKTQVWEYLANLAYGVTTTRDPQTATTDVLSYSDMVEAGNFIGPRVYYTGPGVFWFDELKDQEHTNNFLKRYSEYYDSKTIKAYVSGTRQQRQWVITAARDQKLMPTTEGALDLKLNLTQIIDGFPGHEHSFPIHPLYKDVIQLVAEMQTTYTPTLLVSYGGPWAENYYYTTEEVHDDPKLRRFTPHRAVDNRTLRRTWFHDLRQVFDDHAKFVSDLVAAGGKAGVGGHGQLQGLGYHWELWAIQSGGLSEHDALKVATIFGAEAIGLHNDVGSIEGGKLADMIVLDANPLEDIRNTNSVSMVMKNGRLYDGDTLDQVWPDRQALEGLWWSNREPSTTAGLKAEEDVRLGAGGQ